MAGWNPKDCKHDGGTTDVDYGTHITVTCNLCGAGLSRKDKPKR